MSAFLKSLRSRAAEKIDGAAVGSSVPAGQDPADAAGPARPSARERGAMRRRLREVAHMREAMLLELGAVVFELQRHERDNSDMVERKVAELKAFDDEARGLSAALDEEESLVEVVAAGVSGSCVRCGTLSATDARYCSRCGARLGASEEPLEEPASPGPDAARSSLASTTATDAGEEATHA